MEVEEPPSAQKPGTRRSARRSTKKPAVLEAEEDEPLTRLVLPGDAPSSSRRTLTGQAAARKTSLAHSLKQSLGLSHDQGGEDDDGGGEVVQRHKPASPTVELLADAGAAAGAQVHSAGQELWQAATLPHALRLATALLLVWAISYATCLAALPGGARDMASLVDQARQQQAAQQQLLAALQAAQAAHLADQQSQQGVAATVTQLQTTAAALEAALAAVQAEVVVLSTRLQAAAVEAQQQAAKEAAAVAAQVQTLAQDSAAAQAGAAQLRAAVQQDVGELQSGWQQARADMAAMREEVQRLARLQHSIQEVSATVSQQQLVTTSDMDVALPGATVGKDGQGAAAWQEHRALIAGVVRSALQSYAADQAGRPEYALSAAGGRVVAHSPLYPPAQPRWLRAWRLLGSTVPGVPLPVHPSADQFMLAPGNVPGQCLPLEGTSGYIDVCLRAPIVPEAVTLEHIPASIAYDVSTAPKQLALVGYQGRPDHSGRLTPPDMVAPSGTRLLDFSYDLQRSAVQMFRINATTVVDHVSLLVVSNHGHPNYTCIYRMRVHGREVVSLDGT